MHLVIKKGGITFNEFRFVKGPIYIGRHMHSQIFLPERAVSRQHAVIYITQDGQWVVEDLDSANKTFLNEKPIHKASIQDGDVLKIADKNLQNRLILGTSRYPNPDVMLELIGEWMKKHTKDEIWRKAQALSCPLTPMSSAEDVVRSEQMNARGFFEDVEHPEAGKLKLPARPYRFSKTPCVLERAAPRLGEHNETVYCERLGYDPEELRELEEAGVI